LHSADNASKLDLLSSAIATFLNRKKIGAYFTKTSRLLQALFKHNTRI
jgi:hypothetical protein